jgi:hypothetical protein
MFVYTLSSIGNDLVEATAMKPFPMRIAIAAQAGAPAKSESTLCAP